MRELSDRVARGVLGLGGGPWTPGVTVERVSAPSLADFARFEAAGRPAVFHGVEGVDRLREALALPNLVRRFGDRVVRVANAAGGRLEHDPQHGVPSQLMELARYAELVERGPHPGLSLIASVTEAFPELWAELPPPRYCEDAPWRHSRLFVAAAGNVTPLHRDLSNNLFTQVSGRKRFWLYHRADTPWLSSHSVLSAVPNFSRFDPEAPGAAQRMPPIEVVLEAGDVLFLPGLWWHHVRTLEPSVALSCWWARGPTALAQRAISSFKRLRRAEP